MKYLILILLLFLPTLAHSDETFRNKYGDVSGGYAGSESNDGNGQYTIRDKNGDVTGSIDED